jgi:glycosyltransferase involved in cell wall biosynthesis
MKKPSLSIIIPTLNEEKYLPKLLKDLSQQTFQDFEVIVVDGTSEDKTVQKAQSFKKTLNLFCLTNQKRNVCYQRNHGAKQASADWLVFMDADNRIPPYFLQGIKYRIDLNEADVFTTYLEPDSSHQLDIAIAKAVNVYTLAQKTTKKPVAMESLFIIKKSLHKKLGGFDETVKWGEGTVLLTKVIKHKYIFQVYKDPTYIFSFRRLRAQGKLKMTRSLIQLLFNQAQNKSLSSEEMSHIYPMKGGKFFENTDKDSFEQILIDMSQLTPKEFMQKFFTNKNTKKN